MRTDLRITEHPVLDIEKGRPISFTFDGRTIQGYEGESIAAALYAAGVRMFSRSFKYHRPRGLFCMAGHCSNCLMRVNGVPNVRVCREPARQGDRVRSQNAWPSLDFDLAALTGYVSFLVRPGFQYRRFIRPRWAYHVWEKFLRRMAGIGTLADGAPAARSVRKLASPEIVVVGGGPAGLSAALHAAKAGADVLLVEREEVLGGRSRYDTGAMPPEAASKWRRRCEAARDLAQQAEVSENCRVLKNSTAFAWYDEDVLAVSSPGVFWELTPKRVIVATGSYETPLVFANNDLPGIFSVGALQRLMHRDFVRPGHRAVVVAHDDCGYAIVNQLKEAGVAVAGILDPRAKKDAVSAMEAHGIDNAEAPLFDGCMVTGAVGRRAVKGVLAAGKGGRKVRLDCDTLCLAGTRTPASELLFQRTCEGTFVLSSAHQFTRKPAMSSDMRAGGNADMFVAGEACGSIGMQSAMLQGTVAGLSAALDLGHGGSEEEALRHSAMAQLPAASKP